MVPLFPTNTFSHKHFFIMQQHNALCIGFMYHTCVRHVCTVNEVPRPTVKYHSAVCPPWQFFILQADRRPSSPSASPKRCQLWLPSCGQPSWEVVRAQLTARVQPAAANWQELARACKCAARPDHTLIQMVKTTAWPRTGIWQGALNRRAPLARWSILDHVYTQGKPTTANNN